MILPNSNRSNNYRQIVDKLHKIASESRQPINGTFEITERCNLGCRMCYVNQSSCYKTLSTKELSAKQWLDLAKQAIDCGMFFLLLTGGEIFLRDDFFDIYYPLTQMGLMITLFTNGTLINESIVKRLAKSPPSKVEITLYGATASTYDAVTGVPGSYDRCCDGIELLIKHHIPLALKSTLTQLNVKELDAMKNKAHQWGLQFSSAWLVSKRRDGVKNDTEDIRLSPNECLALEINDPLSLCSLIDEKRFDPAYFDNHLFYCKAGKASFLINSQGKMNVCTQMPFPSASTLDLGFKASWEKVQNFIDNAPPLSPTCMSCDLHNYCLRCPAWSQMETETLTEPIPYLCEIARLRKNHAEKV